MKNLIIVICLLAANLLVAQGENYEYKWNRKTGRNDLVVKTSKITEIVLTESEDIRNVGNLVLDFDTVNYNNLAVFGDYDTLADGATLSFPLSTYSVEFFTDKGHYLKALVFNDTAVSLIQRDSIMNSDSLNYLCYYVNAGYFKIRNRTGLMLEIFYQLKKKK